VLFHINNSKSNGLQRSENNRNFKGKRNEEIRRNGGTKGELLRWQRGVMAKRRQEEMEEQRQIRLKQNRGRIKKRRKGRKGAN
jgi:hypothetical protein